MKAQKLDKPQKKALRKTDVVRRSEQLQNRNCKRFEQKMDGRFYCIDCGKVEYTVL
jgi:hypothetical protein